MRSPSLKPSTQAKYYPLNGGLDVVTPALSIDPGFALALVNFEPWYNGGYRRIDGYERFDGRAKPSDASFTGFTVSSLAGLTLNGTATGGTSHATGVVIGTMSTGGTNYIGVTNVSGTFVNGEGIGTSTAVITSVPGLSVAPSGTGSDGFTIQAEWLANAQNYYRTLIQKVPGTGNVLGAWQRNNNIYAVRASGGVGLLYLASAAGWTTTGISYASTIYFNTLVGSLPANGVTVTGGTSGATAVLHYGILQDTASGYLALTGVVGTFQNGEALKVSGSTFATSTSVATVFALPATGAYRFLNYNFFAKSATYRTYGVNGVGAGFEIDETNVVTPILMPQTALANQPTSNTPFLICEYQNYLVLAFPGGTFQVSVIGNPLQFNGFLGAAEFGVGQEITGMESMVGPALILNTQLNTQALTGNTGATFNLSVVAEKAGARLFSAQILDTVYALNNLGISSLSRTQSYGNFVGSTISQLIQPIVATLRDLFTDSTTVRASNEFRMYFSDGSFLIVYVPGLGQQNKALSAQESGVTAQFGYAQYPLPVLLIYNSEDAVGNEVGYFVSNDGYVYQDRSGTSFDGAAVSSYCRLAFNNLGTPAVRKYFRRADLELNAQTQVNLQFLADLTYSSDESSSAVTGIVASDVPVVNVFGGGGFWNAANWDQFDWDGQTVSTARAALSGTGENVSFLIYHNAIVDQPFILQGLTLQWDARRLQR